jgi:alkyl hydroperoxide reductase subunit AhpC
MVRVLFRTQVKYPVLLDWKGEVSRAYGFSGGEANLVIVDHGGSVVYRTIGPADEGRLEEVFRQIDRLMR